MHSHLSLHTSIVAALSFTVTSALAATCVVQPGCVMPSQLDITDAIDQICVNAYNFPCFNYNGVSFTQTNPSADPQSVCHQAFNDIYDQYVDSYQANGGTYEYNGNTDELTACGTTC